MELDGKPIGDGRPCFVIAELGINHNGSLSTALAMIDAAAEAGADAVKLQMRTVEMVYGRAPYPDGYLDAPREHPLSADQTQRGQKLALEFSTEEHARLMGMADVSGLGYTVSAWDEASVERAARLGVGWLKVGSPVLRDGPLMRAHAASGLPLVVSTGGCDDSGVDAAMGLLEGSEVALLHCCSSYPADDADLNLRCIPAMRERFGVPVGWSSHSRGIATTSAAVALGACIVEAHLTLDRAMYGSDQAASLEPGAFARMVRDIRAVEAALGDGVKRAMPSEADALVKMRRVIP